MRPCHHCRMLPGPVKADDEASEEVVQRKVLGEPVAMLVVPDLQTFCCVPARRIAQCDLQEHQFHADERVGQPLDRVGCVRE